MSLHIKEKQLDQLDIEWVALIKEAKALGISIEEIRLFLTESKDDSISQ